MKTFSRALACPKDSFFLLGPRGTGKSTWLRKQFPHAKVLDLLDERLAYRLSVTPGAFAAELRALRAGTWVVVDEIQRMPHLLDEVHRAMEQQRLRFVLCGSSARKLKRAGVNLLAGRALSREMFPFQPDELGAAFDLESVLRFGALPIVWSSRDRGERLLAYVATYLNEEIRAEATVRNVPAFARFLGVASVLHAQSINTANVARECGVSRPTVDSHIDILEQTLICHRVRAYEGKLRVKERKHPKLYWIDPGLVRAARHQIGAPISAQERGQLFEGLVAATLLAYRSYRRALSDIAYWAPASSHDTEVDFVVNHGDRMVAIESKSGADFREDWCKGLRAFGTPPGVVRRIVVCPETPDLLTDDGIEVMSYRRLASLLHEKELFTTHDRARTSSAKRRSERAVRSRRGA